MITELPLTAMIIIVIALLALFIILRKLTLPKSFYENQAKREELAKMKLWYANREKEESGSTDHNEEPPAEPTV